VPTPGKTAQSLGMGSRVRATHARSLLAASDAAAAHPARTWASRCSTKRALACFAVAKRLWNQAVTKISQMLAVSRPAALTCALPAARFLRGAEVGQPALVSVDVCWVD